MSIGCGMDQQILAHSRNWNSTPQPNERATHRHKDTLSLPDVMCVRTLTKEHTLYGCLSVTFYTRLLEVRDWPGKNTRDFGNTAYLPQGDGLKYIRVSNSIKPYPLQSSTSLCACTPKPHNNL